MKQQQQQLPASERDTQLLEEEEATDEGYSSGVEEEIGTQSSARAAILRKAAGLALRVDGPSWENAFDRVMSPATKKALRDIILDDNVAALNRLKTKAVQRAFVLNVYYSLQQEGKLPPKHRLPSYAQPLSEGIIGCPLESMEPSLLADYANLIEVKRTLAMRNDSSDTEDSLDVVKKVGAKPLLLEERMRKPAAKKLSKEQDDDDDDDDRGELPKSKKRRVTVSAVVDDDDSKRVRERRPTGAAAAVAGAPDVAHLTPTGLKMRQYELRLEHLVRHRHTPPLPGRSFRDPAVRKWVAELAEAVLIRRGELPLDVEEAAEEELRGIEANPGLTGWEHTKVEFLNKDQQVADATSELERMLRHRLSQEVSPKKKKRRSTMV